MPSLFDEERFQLVEKVAGKILITFKNGSMGFSKQLISKLDYPHYVRVFIDKQGKQLGIQVCDKDSDGATRFVPLTKNKVDSVRWHNPTFIKTIKGLVEPSIMAGNFSVEGQYLDEENAVLFDMANAQPI